MTVFANGTHYVPFFTGDKLSAMERVRGSDMVLSSLVNAQVFDGRFLGVVHAHRDADATCGRHPFGGVLDRFGAVAVRRRMPAATARAVDRRTGFAQRCGDAAARAARCTSDDGYLAFQSHRSRIAKRCCS